MVMEGGLCSQTQLGEGAGAPGAGVFQPSVGLSGGQSLIISSLRGGRTPVLPILIRQPGACPRGSAVSQGQHLPRGRVLLCRAGRLGCHPVLGPFSTSWAQPLMSSGF